MPPIDATVERNRRFAASGAYRDATMMPRLGLFVITCLDPRVDPAAFLGIELGDAAVVRNAGARVTDEVIRDVAFTGQLVERARLDGPHSLLDTAVLDPEATVRSDVERLRAARSVSERILISGHVYDVATGLAHMVLRL